MIAGWNHRPGGDPQVEITVKVGGRNAANPKNAGEPYAPQP
jgi:hypothetical protein